MESPEETLTRIQEILQQLNETKQEEQLLLKRLERLRGEALALTEFSTTHPHVGIHAYERFVSAAVGAKPTDLLQHSFVQSLREYIIYPSVTFNGILHKNLDTLASQNRLILSRPCRVLACRCAVCARERTAARIVMDAERPSKKGSICRRCSNVLRALVALYDELLRECDDAQMADSHEDVGDKFDRLTELVHVIQNRNPLASMASFCFKQGQSFKL